MKRGHDTVVALMSRRDEEATLQAAREASSRSRLLPLALIAVVTALYGGLAAYWVVTGEPPGFLRPASHESGLAVPMLAGPEKPQSALLKPPGSDKPTPAKPEPAAKQEPAAVKPDTVATEPPAAAQTRAPALPAAAPAKPAPPPLPDIVIPQSPTGPAPVPQLASLPPPKAVPPLVPAPIADLVRQTPAGPLPVIAADGRMPWQAYARPFAEAGGRARVAVVVGGLGLSKMVTEAAISRLPADVTLAFSPYARDLDAWLKRARAAGHEVLLELPLEAARFPERDAGPLALQASLNDAKVKERLEAVLVKGSGYVGVIAAPGSPFLASDRWPPLLQELRKRGLMYVGQPLAEDLAQPPATAAVAVTLDGLPFRAAIDAHLDQTAAAAKQRGAVVAVTQALPVAIERLVRWSGSLADKGLVLAPVSAVAVPPAAASGAK